MNNEPNAPKVGVLKLIGTLIYLLAFPALLLYLSHDWYWHEAWAFGIWFVVMCSTIIIYLHIKDPALLSERYRQPGSSGQKNWDRFVVYGLMIGFISWIVIMPIDHRENWTGQLPQLTWIPASVLLLSSFFFFFRAYSDNSFLSPLVRIQTERKQQLITSGVYAIVRHPMYFAAVLMFIGAPLLLSSVYGLIPGISLILLLCGRIIGEEKVLTEEFEGYSDYIKKVKFRLIPFIW